MHKLQMLSLEFTGEAIKITSLAEIHGIFVSKTRDVRLGAVLKKCSYNKAHNFNLLSMPRLLHKQGWKINVDTRQ